MKMDSEGNIYCCGPGGIHVFDPQSTGLGVIGPVRMRYDRIIPLVRYVSGVLAPALG